MEKKIDLPPPAYNWMTKTWIADPKNNTNMLRYAWIYGDVGFVVPKIREGQFREVTFITNLFLAN